MYRILLFLLTLVLVACGGNGDTVSDALPLDANQPTFLFFYTDN